MMNCKIHDFHKFKTVTIYNPSLLLMHTYLIKGVIILNLAWAHVKLEIKIVLNYNKLCDR